MSNKGQ
jgi:hypothetical protein